MAITWGAYSNRLRVGIDTWYTGDVWSGAVTVHWRVYVNTDGYGWNDPQTITVSNAMSGTNNYTLVNAIGNYPVIQVWDGSQVVTTSYTGAVSRTLTAAVSGAFNGATPSHSQTITIPQRPPEIPTAPTSATAVRVSDTRADVSWVRPGNADAAASLWSFIMIDRFDEVTDNWTTVVMGLSGTTTSWSDTSTGSNNAYKYRVRPYNAGGMSAGTETNWLDTTPSPPTNVVAGKQGSDILITWDGDVVPAHQWEIRDNGTLIATVPATPKSYLHVAPNSGVTHTYTVRSRLTYAPVLYSDYATSNTVALLAPPAAPSNLSPNGTTIDSATSPTLSWSHNPVDTTAQTAYELQHRLVGAGSWTTVTGTTAQSRVITGYASQANIEWQVRTKGSHATYSPWSALATFTRSALPTVTLNTPTASVTTPQTTFGWAYNHAGASPQSTFQVEIVDNATSIVVANHTGTGTGTSWVSPNVLQNAKSYTARLRARAANGLWSAWVTRSFTVAFTQPAESVVTAAWQDGQGFTLVSAQAVTEAGKPATVSHSVARSLDGQQTWEVLITGMGTSEDFVDWTAPAGGTYHYMVTAYSALPSTKDTVVTVTVPDNPINNTIWVSGGPGFGTALPLPYNPDTSLTMGRDRSLVNFAGRAYPVEFVGVQRPYALSVKAVLPHDAFVPDPAHHTASATREELEALFNLPGPHLYRDPSGRVVFGSVSALSWSRAPGGIGDVSFTITRTAKPTANQAAALARYYDNEGWTEL